MEKSWVTIHYLNQKDLKFRVICYKIFLTKVIVIYITLFIVSLISDSYYKATRNLVYLKHKCGAI